MYKVDTVIVVCNYMLQWWQIGEIEQIIKLKEEILGTQELGGIELCHQLNLLMETDDMLD